MPDFVDKIRSLIEDAQWKDAANPSWWVNFLRHQARLYFYIARETVQDRCLRQAAALTFTSLLAIVPLLVVAFSFFRGFDAFEGLEKRAERAVFNTILSAPMVRGGAQRTDWDTSGTNLPSQPSDDVSADTLVEKADALPRRSRAYQAGRLYLEALDRGADPTDIRTGLASLYFGHRQVMQRFLGKVPKETIEHYESAASLPPEASDFEKWKGYKHYVNAISHQDQLNYQDALDELIKAESHHYPIAKTRLATAQTHAALANAKNEKQNWEAAANHYDKAMKLTTDGLVLGINKAIQDTIQRLIKLHNQTLRRYGQALLAMGQHRMELYDDMDTDKSEVRAEILQEITETLREATRYLEHSPEAHSALAEALWEKGDREAARDQYLKASQSTSTDAARGFSVAVADNLQQIVNRASSAGLGIISMLFLVLTATSLFSTTESTLNGIWQV
ncbi:MAG: hypothetical protein ACOC0A_01020, partial [Planctomycetota bacterium]